MLLINSSPRNPIKVFQPFTPVYVPIGIGYLLATAENNGISAYCIDEQIDRDILGKAAAYVSRMAPPYLFGFSVLTAGLDSAVRVSGQLKKLYPDSVVCFGGIHPTAAPEEVLSYPHIDMVLRGEGERSIIELYKCVKGRRDITHIKGLSYLREGKVVHNDRSLPVEDLDSRPFPYHLFASKRYDLGFIISSRGCPHSCIFCSNRVTTGKKYRIRSAGAIVDELDMLHERYGKTQILFLDDNLLVSEQRVRLLLEEIRMRGLHNRMNFSFQARGDNVNRELLEELYASGFKSVFFGLETASERIMKIIRKGETVAQCADAVRMAKEIGFHVSATFIYALPGETHDDRMDCVSMSKELCLDMVRFNNATPYPGTELYEIAKREGRLHVRGVYENFNSVSTFIENPFNEIPFSYVPVGSTENEIRRDILFSYFNCYLDMSKLKKIFARPDLGVRWFSAGGHFLEIVKKLPALMLLMLMLVFKFGQFVYYGVIKKETAISLKFVVKIFDNLCPGSKRKKVSVQ